MLPLVGMGKINRYQAPDAAAVAAQKGLADIQGRVRKLVEAEPDIERVSWRVDVDWLAAHGVQLQP
jgi:hypothetical protein